MAVGSTFPIKNLEHDDGPLPSGTPDRADGFERIDDVWLTMRDGVRLLADVYLPKDRSEPLPSIVTRLPYGKREDYCDMPRFGEFWTRKGYAFVVQDVRGKWGSEGVFEPNRNKNETTSSRNCGKLTRD